MALLSVFDVADVVAVGLPAASTFSSDGIVVGIDAGLRGCGVAMLYNGELLSAQYVESTELSVRGPQAWLAMANAVATTLQGTKVDVLCIETMQAYPKSNQAQLV